MKGAAYTAEQREYFAEFIEARAPMRPAECHHGSKCWVIEGPPAFCTSIPGKTTAKQYCAGCGGSIVIPNRLRDPRRKVTYAR